MTDEERTALRDEQERLRSIIDFHFTRFCYLKRCKPPVLVVPEVVARFAEIGRLLRADSLARRARRGT